MFGWSVQHLSLLKRVRACQRRLPVDQLPPRQQQLRRNRSTLPHSQRSVVRFLPRRKLCRRRLLDWLHRLGVGHRLRRSGREDGREQLVRTFSFSFSARLLTTHLSQWSFWSRLPWNVLQRIRIHVQQRTLRPRRLPHWLRLRLVSLHLSERDLRPQQLVSSRLIRRFREYRTHPISLAAVLSARVAQFLSASLLVSPRSASPSPVSRPITLSTGSARPARVLAPA